MPKEPRSGGPPHNPGVRDLVSGKRRWSSPPDRTLARLGFRGWHERGYLPHRDEPSLTQFVTFRLADAFPAALRSEWAALLEIEDNRERRKQLEAYLDKGRGECYLRRDDVARVVEDSLRFFHGRRYDLRAWTVMPNHVHVLFKADKTSMAKILKDWKSCTSREANKLVGRHGQFWEEDYWDTYMRDAEHELKSRRYIENNPVKAKLVRDPKDWPWSSARFRDPNGVLHL
jgi:REP element-mobilizing transposase RayT